MINSWILKLINFFEKKAEDPKIKGNETVKLCKVGANIALDVLSFSAKGSN